MLKKLEERFKEKVKELKDIKKANESFFTGVFTQKVDSIWDQKTKSIIVDTETLLKIHSEIYETIKPKQQVPQQQRLDQSADLELLTVFKEENEHLKMKMHDMNKQLSFEQNRYQ